MASLVDDSVQSTIVTGMSKSAAAAVDRRVGSFDALATGATAMWQIALTSPTVFAAQGIRHLTESGAGRTRLEANRPPETSAAAPIS